MRKKQYTNVILDLHKFRMFNSYGIGTQTLSFGTIFAIYNVL